MSDAAVLARRLARLRTQRNDAVAHDAGSAEIRQAITALRDALGGPPAPREPPPRPEAAEEDGDHWRAQPAKPSVERAVELAERLATALDGEVVRDSNGCHVRYERPSVSLPLDRERLLTLPGRVPASVPLVCLDIETTGLATAAGTAVFLIGLGWWEADRFRQVALLLPDQSEERSLLGALSDLLPPAAWLVTYNGRSFDWPLLVARYRMVGAPPPAHAGHLDLLHLVRRVARHRLTNARLITVEAELLASRRIDDVGGWEIPGFYLDFLRGGSAAPLIDVVRHNHEDVRSLGRLLSHLEHAYGDAEIRATAHRGDLVGLARAYRAEGRHDEAIDCFDAAMAAPEPLERGLPLSARWGTESLPFGARPWEAPPFGSTLDEDVWRAERARLLRRLGRHDEVLAAWLELARDGGPLAVPAWIELAKLYEHRLKDPLAALSAVEAAARLVERARFLRRPRPHLEADLNRRRLRLRRRLARARPAA